MFGKSVHRARSGRRRSAPVGLFAACYAVVGPDGAPCSRARTGDLLAAHRWWWATEGGVGIGVRRFMGRGRWRCMAPALRVPPAWEHGERTAAAWICDELLPAPRGPGRVRAAALLLRRGVDGAGAASLLRHHAGHFPSLAVAVARTLQARVGGLYLLRRLDLRAVIADLIADAAIWTLPDTRGGSWPAGVHLFMRRETLTDGPQAPLGARSTPAGGQAGPRRPPPGR